MKKTITALSALAAAMVASPAAAVVTLSSTDGTPLDYQIFGIKDTGNPVYGSSPNNTDVPNVTYDADTITTMNIKDGFAQINDANAHGTPTWTQLIVNPDYDFTQMKFALQTTDAATVDVYYLLAGSGLDANLFSSYTDTCATCFFSTDNKSDDKFLIAGDTFDGIMLKLRAPVSLAPVADPPTFFEFKQNSYDPAPGAVPEPATWAMMLAGFGAAGLAMRSRRRKVVPQIA
jgi:hypothetical protein